MEHHFVGHGCTLMFRYGSGCKFHVCRFDPSRAKIVYPSGSVKTIAVQKNGMGSHSSKIRSTIVNCSVSEHGVPLFKKDLSYSVVTGNQHMAFPASFLKDNNLLLNKKYKHSFIEIPIDKRGDQLLDSSPLSLTSFAGDVAGSSTIDIDPI
ncbi:hypothetical protein ACFE04_000403 [Oxalis oulophora]